MHILIIPGTLDPINSWNGVITLLEEAGLRVTLLKYTIPKTDDVEDQTNLAESYLIEKTLLVGEGVGGRICIQLLARRNPYVCGAVLMATPSLLYKSFVTKLQNVLAFFLLPIRLFLSRKRKQKISDALLRLRYRNPAFFQYRKSVDSAQDTLLPIISVYVKLVWGAKKARVPHSVAEEMKRMLKNADFVTIAATAEPLQLHAPRVLSNIIREAAETH